MSFFWPAKSGREKHEANRQLGWGLSFRKGTANLVRGSGQLITTPPFRLAHFSHVSSRTSTGWPHRPRCLFEGPWLRNLIWSNMFLATKGKGGVKMVYVCTHERRKEREHARERENSKGTRRSDTLITAREGKEKKKKAFWFTSSLTLRRAAVVHPVSSLSFSLSLPPRTQWINQIPAHFFPFPSFFSGFISSAVFECTWRDPHLTFKFGWHWSAPQTFSCGEEEKKKTVQRLFFFFGVTHLGLFDLLVILSSSALLSIFITSVKEVMFSPHAP